METEILKLALQADYQARTGHGLTDAGVEKVLAAVTAAYGEITALSLRDHVAGVAGESVGLALTTQQPPAPRHALAVLPTIPREDLWPWNVMTVSEARRRLNEVPLPFGDRV